MSKFDLRLEAVAKAICVGHGLDPDREVIINRASYHHKRGPQWQKFVKEARAHIAAWDCLRSLEREL